MTEQSIQDSVKEYYGEVLKSKNDLQTSACCTAEDVSDYLKPILSQIHPEVMEKFYGCGAPLPDCLEGKTVLDLGCGTGRDCFVISKLVGSAGKVIGIDMTDSQLEVAEKHKQYHADKFGYAKSNVTFLKGYIENLEAAGIKSESVDVIVSNCVINLSPEKDRVFREIFRVLKPGGELYFSDVFADRRLPKEFQTDKVLLGECLGGAMYVEDFRRLISDIGCKDFRTVTEAPIEVTSGAIKNKLGLTNFSSKTIRAFKIDLEDRCEDYGQVAYYKGTIPHSPNYFILDDHHLFETNKPLLVCSNSASMLKDTRYGQHFRIEGDLSTHFGLFDCGPTMPQSTGQTGTDTSGSCC